MYILDHFLSHTETPADTNEFGIHDFFLWERCIGDTEFYKGVDEIGSEWTPARIGGDVTDTGEVNQKIRKHSVKTIEYNINTQSLFKTLIDPINGINFWHFNFKIWSMEDLQVNRFAKGDFFSLHSDRTRLVDRSERKLTVIAALSDSGSCTGGEINLSPHANKKYETTLRLNKGDLLVFPCWVPYEVKPVKTGEAEYLTSWMYGPKFN